MLTPENLAALQDQLDKALDAMHNGIPRGKHTRFIGDIHALELAIYLAIESTRLLDALWSMCSPRMQEESDKSAEINALLKKVQDKVRPQFRVPS